MATPSPQWTDAHCELAALITLYSRCPTLYDDEAAFASPTWTVPWPDAPTTFGGDGSHYPTNGGYLTRIGRTEADLATLPVVYVHAGTPRVAERLEGGSQLIGVPVTALIRLRADHGSGPKVGPRELRHLAMSAATAMEWLLLTYLPATARAQDASTAWGIVSCERDALPVAGEVRSASPRSIGVREGSEGTFIEGACRVLVTQHRPNPITTSA